MSEQGRSTAARDQQITHPPGYAPHRHAPLPPPVSGRQLSSRSSDRQSHALRRRPLSDPSNHHRHRVRQGRPMWPWLSILGLTIAGGLASLVVLAAEEPHPESVGNGEPSEAAAGDRGVTSVTSTARIASEDADANTTAVLAGPAATSQVDPFDRYLELVGEWGITDAPDLSRDEARTRALLGCSEQWAPGTLDAALAEAYDDVLQPYRDQGVCG